MKIIHPGYVYYNAALKIEKPYLCPKWYIAFIIYGFGAYFRKARYRFIVGKYIEFTSFMFLVYNLQWATNVLFYCRE